MSWHRTKTGDPDFTEKQDLCYPNVKEDPVFEMTQSQDMWSWFETEV